MTSIRQARKDWADLKKGFLVTEAALAQVVRNKSWEPLGYRDFGDAWATELAGITLAAEIRPHAAYYLFEAGYGPDWVAENLKGVSGPRADEWHAEYRSEVPPAHFNKGALSDKRALRNALGASDDETVVPPHIRQKPSKPAYVRFDIGHAMHQECTRVAKELGLTLEDISRFATLEVFRMLVALSAEKKRRRVA